jgi:hypothetical protein
MRALLRRDLDPSPADRQRIRNELQANLSHALLPGGLENVAAEMATRAATLKTGASLWGSALASKLVVVGLAVATTSGVATYFFQASPEPTHASPSVAKPTVTPKQAVPPRTEPAGAGEELRPQASETASNPALAVAPVQPLAAAPRRGVRASARARTDAVVVPAPVSTELAREDVPEKPAILPVDDPRQASASPPALALGAQLALVREASNALDRHEYASALALLSDYSRSHPQGAFLHEVSALRAIALCEAHSPEAPAVRAAYLAEHPSSTLAARVRKACAERP